MSEYVSVMRVDHLPDKSSKVVHVAGKSILVCRSGGDIYAVDNRCSHRGKALEGGLVRGGCITCPEHGERFDLASGKPKGKLTRVPISAYPVRVVDGWIEIAVFQSK